MMEVLVLARADFFRLFSLGFSKYRFERICFMVPSRSIIFFKRFRALSTASPFLTLT